MRADGAIPFRDGLGTVVNGAQLREQAAWREAFARQAKDHRFYEIVEQTLRSGFEYHYLILQDHSGEVRAVQPFFFVQQNLVEGVPALRLAVGLIRKTFPRFLTMRVLMVGCAAGPGHLGACRRGDEEWVVEALRQTLPTCARLGHASLIVWKDFPACYRTLLADLTAHGYTRVPSMPMTGLSLDYRDFEEYLGTLSSKTRKDLRRKFRKGDSPPPITCEVLTEILPLLDEIHPLYLQVYERSPLKFECLSKEYFRALSERMPDRARFFIWRYEGRIVAFNLCFVHDHTIYDEYLGLDYRVALDLHLYFYRLRDVLSWAIRHGLTRYYSSPLNYEPKLRFGSELAPLDLYVLHTTPLLNPLVGRAVKLLGPTRHDPVLRHFANANEL